MEISQRLQEFLKDPENQELLNEYRFEELYKKLYDFSYNCAVFIGNFSALMYEINIDTLLYLEYIP